MPISINGTGTITGLSAGGLPDGSITMDELSNSATESDNVAKRTAKAWVNFNGTGTVAIRASFNVSSVGDNGNGDYRVNFTTAMPDADYAAVATSSNTGVAFGAYAVGYEGYPGRDRTINSWAFWTGSFNSLQDSAFNNVVIFR
jgi:hypothetical protein